MDETKLYDIGYSEIKDANLLLRVAKKLDAIVVDARFSPRSRNPTWNQGNLKTLLKDRYEHVQQIGNRNYHGGPIEFVDVDEGVEQVGNLLMLKSVILMCMCPNRDKCHRTEFAKIFEQRTGIQLTPLTLEYCQELVGDNSQLKLFG